MKFQVPQFIDTEDKIFGPLSFKEFSYIAGACGLSYIFYRYIPSFLLSLVFIIPILAFGAALAFYRPNNKPYIERVQAMLSFGLGKKLYIWKKENKPMRTREIDLSDKTGASINIPNLSGNKLNSLNWDLDTQRKSPEGKGGSDNLNLKI